MLTKLRASVADFREVVSLLWAEASTFVRRRLALVVVLVIAASVLTALGPVALKMIVDSFTGQTKNAAIPLVFLIGFYVLSHWLASALGEVRGLVFARAERRMYRTLSERLFAHIMQLPLLYHVDRQTGAVNQTLQNGLQGCQMVLNVLVFSILPVVAELGTVIVVLSKLNQPTFLALFGAAIACYAMAFAYAAASISEPAKAYSAAQIDANASMTDSIVNSTTG